MEQLDELIIRTVRFTDTGCWEWTGRSCKGYGRLSIKGTDHLAHRLAYEVFIGPIPEGLVLDHVVARGCRTTLCVNPNHLEAVTQAENLARSANTMQAIKRTWTHCVNGHPFNAANTRWEKRGVRKCRTCHAARMRRNRANRDRAPVPQQE